MKILTYDDLKPQKGIAYSKVQIWRLEKNNKFPKRIQLGPGRHGWLDNEINDWIGPVRQSVTALANDHRTCNQEG